MRFMSMLAAAAGVVMGQGQDAGTGDGGVADGGVAVVEPAQPAAPQAGSPQQEQPSAAKPTTTVVVDRGLELEQLRNQVQSMQTTAQEMNAKLDAAVTELREVRQQLAEGRRMAQQAEQLHATQQQAAVSLSAGEQRLATGDTTVSGLMQTLGASLGPAARLSLDNAQAALTNNDVATARMFLSQAVLEANAGR